MASTLDSTIKGVQKSLSVSASKAVHKGAIDIFQGKPIDPKLVTDIANTAVGQAMGAILNKSSQTVNSTISKALGKKFKNSSLNLIAGNYVSDVLTSVITGRKTPEITVHMTNAITDNISRELYARLPKSVTKNVSINALGTKFTTGLTPYVSKAINETVGALVNAAVGIPSGATKLSLPSLPTKTPSIPSFSMPDFTKLSPDFGKIMGGLTSLSSSLGSSMDVLISSLSGSAGSMKNISLPAGTDMSRFKTGNPGIGKLVELASAPMGSITGVPGLTKDQFMNIQSQMVATNVNNPLGSLGGTFPNMKKDIEGAATSNGVRGITKDLTTKFADINNSLGVMSEKDKTTLAKVKDDTVEIGKSAAKQATDQAASFKSMTPDQLEKLTTIKEGFKDPNAKYPLPDYKNRTETNKLSTGDAENTIVDKKNSDRMRGAQLPNGASWDQPTSPYNAKYPYNHVRETESGHVIELDDTPGSERIHVFHKSGTFMEVDALGNRVQVIKGSDYTIVDNNGYISIQGKANVSVNGSINIFVGGDANIEVDGNTHVNCHNNMELNAAGRLKLTAGEGIDIRSPEVFIDADNTLQINADVSAKLHVKEFNMIVDTDMKMNVNNDYRLSVKNNSDTIVGAVTKHYSNGEIHFGSGASIFNTTMADYHVKANSSVKTSCGTEYHVKSGESIFHTSGTDFNIKAGADANLTAIGNINNMAGSSIVEAGTSWVMTTSTGIVSSSGGNININTSGYIAMDGSNIWMNSGMSATSADTPVSATPATAATESKQAAPADALETEYCDTHYLDKRKPMSESIKKDSFVKEQTASKVASNVVQAVAQGSTTITPEAKAALIEDHGIEPASIEKKPIILETAKNDTVPDVTQIIPSEIPLGNEIIPANMKLSPYFTVESFTRNANNSTELKPVGDVLPLSKIVTNLQYIALNVMEPIYAARPDVIIDTGFVPLFDKQKVYTRYNFGLAVALDFKDATGFDDYYDIANMIKQVIPYDEIIIMYMSASFTGSHHDSGLIIINVPGVNYPNMSSIEDAYVLDQWIDVNNRRKAKTWFNGKLVSEDSLVKVA